MCCCTPCQRYAHTLGRAEEMLDAHGGTSVFQVSPARLQLTAGQEHLACIQQTPKGALRWYASCCDSPIANTLPSMQVPFMAVQTTFIDRAYLERAGVERPLDELLGPLRVTVNGRIPPELARPLKATRWALVKMLFRYSPMILAWRLRGEHKQSPFFDARTGLPTRPPQERGRLVAAPPKQLTPKRAGCG